MSVGLVIQHTMRMRRIVLSSVVCPAAPFYFSHYLTNGRIFEKKLIEHKMCVLIVSKQTLAEIFLILRIIHRYSCRILMKLEFS